jgi:hypothetical protein
MAEDPRDMNANTPGTNTGMTPRGPNTPQPAAPPSTPLIASPSDTPQSSRVRELLRGAARTLGSPRSVMEFPASPAGPASPASRASAASLVSAAGPVSPASLASRASAAGPLVTPLPPLPPQQSQQSSASLSSLDLGTPRQSDSEYNGEYELSDGEDDVEYVPEVDSDVDLIELRF